MAPSTTNSNSNIAPIASAGNDTTILSPINVVTLHGGRVDQNSGIVSYSWDQISGPTSADILTKNSKTTDVGNLTAGTYDFELTVVDSLGGIGKDTVKVTIALGRIAPAKTTTVKVYPNPVHDITTVEINTDHPNTNIALTIADIYGHIVYRDEFVCQINETKRRVNMSNLIKGTYVISLFFDGIEQQSVKVLRL